MNYVHLEIVSMEELENWVCVYAKKKLLFATRIYNPTNKIWMI